MGWTHTGAKRPAFAETPGPGQESVWDFPRPARAFEDSRSIRVSIDGERVAETGPGTRPAVRVLETSHPPSFYLPPESIVSGRLRRVSGTTRCEWKGEAVYFDVVGSARSEPRAAWAYPEPFEEFEGIRDFVAFYPDRLECFVDGVRAQPQPGGFYAGWITPDLVGPFKGSPGSSGW